MERACSIFFLLAEWARRSGKCVWSVNAVFCPTFPAFPWRTHETFYLRFGPVVERP